MLWSFRQISNNHFITVDTFALVITDWWNLKTRHQSGVLSGIFVDYPNGQSGKYTIYIQKKRLKKNWTSKYACWTLLNDNDVYYRHFVQSNFSLRENKLTTPTPSWFWFGQVFESAVGKTVLKDILIHVHVLLQETMFTLQNHRKTTSRLKNSKASLQLGVFFFSSVKYRKKGLNYRSLFFKNTDCPSFRSHSLFICISCAICHIFVFFPTISHSVFPLTLSVCLVWPSPSVLNKSSAHFCLKKKLEIRRSLSLAQPKQSNLRTSSWRWKPQLFPITAEIPLIHIHTHCWGTCTVCPHTYTHSRCLCGGPSWGHRGISESWKEEWLASLERKKNTQDLMMSEDKKRQVSHMGQL